MITTFQNVAVTAGMQGWMQGCSGASHCPGSLGVDHS